MKSFPFDSHVTYDTEGTPIFDRAINSKTYRYIFRELFSNGIMPNPSTNLQVTAGEGMNVIVLPGFAMVDGCMNLEEDNRTLAIQSAAAQYDRIDSVVLRLNANDGYRNCDLYISEGVPSANPVRPDLVREGDVYELGLADLYITKNSSSISEAKITDTRYETERCGVISSISEFDTSTLNQQMNAWAIEQQQEFGIWSDDQRAAFEEWLASIQGILDADMAGHLQTEIEAVSNNLNEHINDEVRHITAEEREMWNNAGINVSGSVTAKLTNITASTTDIEAGTTALATGQLYVVYE